MTGIGWDKLSRLQYSGTWDPGNAADSTPVTTDLTVPGAEMGDFVLASFSLDVLDVTLTAQVTAANTVTASLVNTTGSGVNLTSGTLRVVVFKKESW